MILEHEQSQAFLFLTYVKCFSFVSLSPLNYCYLDWFLGADLASDGHLDTPLLGRHIVISSSRVGEEVLARAVNHLC